MKQTVAFLALSFLPVSRSVEELAARAEEAKRMEGCLNKEKLAEEKIR